MDQQTKDECTAECFEDVILIKCVIVLGNFFKYYWKKIVNVEWESGHGWIFYNLECQRNPHNNCFTTNDQYSIQRMVCGNVGDFDVCLFSRIFLYSDFALASSVDSNVLDFCNAVNTFRRQLQHTGFMRKTLTETYFRANIVSLREYTDRIDTDEWLKLLESFFQQKLFYLRCRAQTKHAVNLSSIQFYVAQVNQFFRQNNQNELERHIFQTRDDALEGELNQFSIDDKDLDTLNCEIKRRETELEQFSLNDKDLDEFERQIGVTKRELKLNHQNLDALELKIFERETELGRFRVDDKDLDEFEGRIGVTKRELKLNHQNLGALELKIFERETELGQFSLNDQDLDELERQIGVTKRKLELNHQNLGALELKIFERETELGQFSLNDQDLDELERQIGEKELGQFSLNDQDRDELERQNCEKELGQFSLNDQDLDELERQIGEKETELGQFSLNDRDRDELERQIFERETELEQFSLNDQDLGELERQIGVTKRELELNHQNLGALELKIFERETELDQFLLNDQDLGELERQIGARETELDQFSLNDQDFDELEAQICAREYERELRLPMVRQMSNTRLDVEKAVRRNEELLVAGDVIELKRINQQRLEKLEPLANKYTNSRASETKKQFDKRHPKSK